MAAARGWAGPRSGPSWRPSRSASWGWGCCWPCSPEAAEAYTTSWPGPGWSGALTASRRGPTTAIVPTDLAALLVEEGAVAGATMDQALARQAQLGGALDTALLELDAVYEAQ